MWRWVVLIMLNSIWASEMEKGEWGSRLVISSIITYLFPELEAFNEDFKVEEEQKEEVLLGTEKDFEIKEKEVEKEFLASNARVEYEENVKEEEKHLVIDKERDWYVNVRAEYWDRKAIKSYSNYDAFFQGKKYKEASNQKEKEDPLKCKLDYKHYKLDKVLKGQKLNIKRNEYGVKELGEIIIRNNQNYYALIRRKENTLRNLEGDILSLEIEKAKKEHDSIFFENRLYEESESWWAKCKEAGEAFYYQDKYIPMLKKRLNKERMWLWVELEDIEKNQKILKEKKIKKKKVDITSFELKSEALIFLYKRLAVLNKREPSRDDEELYRVYEFWKNANTDVVLKRELFEVKKKIVRIKKGRQLGILKDSGALEYEKKIEMEEAEAECKAVEIELEEAEARLIWFYEKWKALNKELGIK
jgi:hypothetical protein